MPWGFKYHEETDCDPFHLKPIDVQPPTNGGFAIALFIYAAIIAGLIWLIS